MPLQTGTIREIYKFDNDIKCYAISFIKYRKYYDATTHNFKRVKYNFIIKLYGVQADKIINRIIRVGTSVVCDYRIESSINIYEGKRYVQHKVICNSIYTEIEYYKINNNVVKYT